jgi:hypothetical protein
MDALDDETRVTTLEARAKALGLPFYRISAVSGAGVPELLEAMWQEIAAERSADAAAPPVPADPSLDLLATTKK